MKIIARQSIRCCVYLFVSLLTINANAQVSGSVLMAGTKLERPIEPGKVDSYRISLRARDYVRVVVTQEGTDVVVKLLGPDGKELIGANAVQAEGAETVSWVATTGGDYQIQVQTREKVPAGRYLLTVTDLHSATKKEKEAFDRERQLEDAKLLDTQLEKLFAEAKYGAAIALAQQSLEIRRRNLAADDLQVADSLHNLATFYLYTGDYSKAEPFLKQSLEIREHKLGKEDLQVARSLNSLAGLAQEVGNYETAGELFGRALTIRKSKLGPNHPLVAQSTNNLALLYTAKKDYKQAEGLFIEAHEHLKKGLGHENHPVIANSLNGLAVVYQEQGDLERAEPLYMRALEIQERLLGQDHPTVANTIHNLAVLYLLKSDFARAEPLYRRAADTLEKTLGLRHPRFANALESIGIMYQTKGDVDRALELFTRAGDIREANLALVIASGSEKEKRLYMDTLDMQANVAISLHLRYAPEKVSAARLALTTILRRKGRVLDALTDSLGALRRRSRADQALLTKLSSVRSDLARVVLNGLGQRTRVQHEAEINKLESEAQRLEAEISSQSAKFRTETEAVTIEKVQQAIPPDAALVEMAIYRPFDSTARVKSEALGQPRYVAYILGRDGAPTFVDLGDASSIDKRVTEFREVLATPTSDVKEISRSLDEQLMRPIRQKLGSITNVFLSTDSALNLVPFAALIDEGGRYLVENSRMTYLTSGRDLLRLQTYGHSTRGPMVAFANPTFTRRQISETRHAQTDSTTATNESNDFIGLDFQPIAGASKEAEALKTILPRLKVNVGPKATEGAIKSIQKPSILHVATHGFFLSNQSSSGTGGAQRSIGPQNPLLRSGLAFAGANQLDGGDGEDGILTALEATGLDLLGTKLVVLSACETGVGDVRNGDGVYGLRRALVLAGSESQVISLWKVNDDATKDLMVDYYKQLQRGLGRTEALRQVQLSMLKNAGQSKSRDSRGAVIAFAGAKNDKDLGRSHPYYWASFIQSGDWRSLKSSVEQPQ